MFNYDKFAEVLKERFLNEQAETCKNDFIGSNDVIIEKRGDFFIGVGKAVASVPIIDDKYMQRYFLYVYSVGHLGLIYKDSNVVGGTEFAFTFDDVVKKAKTHLEYELNKLKAI